MFGTFNLVQTGNYHVKGSGIFSRTDSPYMQVMPAVHSLCLTDFLLQFVEVDVLRHGIQCKVETLFQEFPGLPASSRRTTSLFPVPVGNGCCG